MSNTWINIPVLGGGGSPLTFTPPLVNTGGVVTFSGPSVSAVSAFNIDWSVLGLTGGVYTKSITGNATFTFSSVIAGQTVLIQVTSSGSFTVTWPTSCRGAFGTIPTQSFSSSDLYSLTAVTSSRIIIQSVQGLAA